MKPPLRLIVLFLVILLPINSYGMWMGVSDAQLIQQSALIVKANYVGATTITVNKQALRLGVLSVKSTLKGNPQEVIFIQLTVTPKGFPQRSDDINFSVNQKGLWMLQKTTLNGIYKVNTPQHFIPEQQLKTRLPLLLPLIKNN